MIASILVLVIAPDKDFRRSLEFALEAEGFAVDPHTSISHAFISSRMKIADCAVIDDAAIEDWQIAKEQLRRFARPVVLLAGRIRPLPHLPLTTIVTKPFLGNPLIDAVREAATSAL